MKNILFISIFLFTFIFADSLNVRYVGGYDTPGYSYGVYVLFPYVYVADGSRGLQIYQFYGTGINEEKKRGEEIKSFSLKDKKTYDISGKLIKEKRLKKGIYFKQTEKGIKKILILK